MYLESIKLKNFRKFGEDNNEVSFVSSRDYSSLNEKGVPENNIALATTLIVGKNNTGKTTITNALKKIVSNKNEFLSTDFNFKYLSKVIESYKKGDRDKYLLPFIEFELIIGINDECKDSTVNIKEFLNIKNIKDSYVKIKIRNEIVEDEIFANEAEALIKKYIEKEQSFLFSKFLDLISGTAFHINYYNSSDEKVTGYSIKSLIELKIIEANNINSENDLTTSFNKIITYKNKNLNKEMQETIDSEINAINEKIDTKVYKEPTEVLNKIVKKVDNHVEVNLQSNITITSILTKSGKYRYIEEEFLIPENQFGLGYTNLMKIIAEIIDYVEKYPNDCQNSKINIISIEEPETFMHPQMQECFIENINKAIVEILNGNEKILNCQIIMTTHSSHILNSKINMGNTFNNINYLTDINNQTNSIKLSDKIINPSLFALRDQIEKEQDEINKEELEYKLQIEQKNLKFIKKHIKYKVSELFFSDAVILCEGITEETLLKYYIGQNDELKKYYITIFNIDGAHAKIYNKLLEILKVPAVIITDIDFDRNDEEKTNFKQINSIEKRVSTNPTLNFYLSETNSKINDLSKKTEKENIFLAFQNESIENYFATSFEEAFILTNSGNTILQNVLKNIKPGIYNQIVTSTDASIIKKEICNNSYKWQSKLSKVKSEFANTLLYEMLTSDENPILPDYIKNGLTWLEDKFKGNI